VSVAEVDEACPVELFARGSEVWPGFATNPHPCREEKLKAAVVAVTCVRVPRAFSMMDAECVSEPRAGSVPSARYCGGSRLTGACGV
jgi:hypothetical protein